MRPGAFIAGLFVLPLTSFLAGRSAQAHIKWFAPYDLNKSPLPIGDVVTAQFVYFFLSSLLVIYAFFWVDRFVLRKQFLEGALRRLIVTEPVAFAIMRAAAFAFF